MKVKIDSMGGLWLEKRGVMKLQYCIHKTHTICGEQCPKFHILKTDPLTDKPYGSFWKGKRIHDFIKIKICQDEFRIKTDDYKESY